MPNIIDTLDFGDGVEREVIGSPGFIGTLEQWNALSPEEQSQYTVKYITNDFNGVPIDSELSSTSTNPVQNKKLTAELNKKADSDSLGTASTKDVPASGDASSTEVVMGNDTRLTDSRPASDVSAWAKASTKPTYTASEVGAIATTEKGANNGVAELDSAGKVLSSQLPSYVDDVIEYPSLADFPLSGESGKIYVAVDTNTTYRWSGSEYVAIGSSLALGETSSTAYRGDRGKIAYDDSQANKAAIAAINTTLAGIIIPTIISATLSAGSTTVEFNVPTSGNNLIEFYISDGSSYTELDTSVTGKATLTYGASASARTVVCKIQEVPNE